LNTSIHPWVEEARSRVGFAIVGAFLDDYDALRNFVLDVEDRGFDAYWVNDHPTRSMDTFTTLAALASETARIQLISLVSCVYYRHPFLIARGAADVDRISHGRFILGLGMGDDVEEFSQLGIPFPASAKRRTALDEAVQTVQSLLSGQPLTRSGLFELSDARLTPGPVQEPRIPLLIGGGGERFTLRQVARYADISNFGAHEWAGGAFDAQDVRRKYAVLRRYCDEEVRHYDAILRSHWTPLLSLATNRTKLEKKRATARVPDAHLRVSPLFATPEQAIAHYELLLDAGVQYFLATVDSRDTETIDLLAGQVVPALKPRL
jgi:alkanesulfonate monooxygenase SsuD/methylene tetrahydromethanopterin reductase-like flavin-dependent oxidoreductase (luciferase family)